MCLFLAILHLIAGRDETLNDRFVRRPIYRVEVEKNWIRLDPDPEEAITDTTKANVTYLIDGDLRLTVHTFPSEQIEERIPPQAQVSRWQRQSGSPGEVTPISRGGFSGLFYACPTVYAWSLQLDPYHYHHLTLLADSREEWEHYKQMRADYTIKVSGPPEKLALHRKAILLFAQSFELIQELF